MRGKAPARMDMPALFGITPAHAGKRLEKYPLEISARDHPRPCGEKPHAR